MFGQPVEKLIVAELERGRAEEILRSLRGRAEDRRRAGPGAVDRARSARERSSAGSGGVVSIEEGIALLADRLVKCRRRRRARSPEAARSPRFWPKPGANQKVRGLALDCLKAEAKMPRTSGRPRFRVERRTLEPADTRNPSSHLLLARRHADSGPLRSTRPRRSRSGSCAVERRLVDDLTTKMTDPAPDEVGELCELLYQLLVPTEFRSTFCALGLSSSRSTARWRQLHWEMLATRRRRRWLRAARRPKALRAAAPHHLQPGADPAAAPGRGVPRADRRRPRRPSRAATTCRARAARR